ncbi:hypothetical protein BC830DRAFT_1110035 [Chytriomyces sp. MP71]|nr:hypothetical protein BC830DRAFT_1129476 [Chytriomyces sp. MP71]KAI8618219.1 hypothetical protein BC830DRAFT_1110035 [Chytriomyces sp. MP71]
MITIGAVASINQVTGLTAFRFLVIMHDAIIKKTYAILFTAISFTISAIVVFIPFLMKSEDRSFGLHPTHLTCTIVWYSHDPATRIVTAVCVIVLAIPISFIGYAYFSIYRRVSRSINTLKETVTSRHPHNSESTSTATALENGRTVVLHEDEARKSKLLVQSIAVVLVMLLGWGPYFILGLWELVASVPVPLKYEYAAEIMVQMNAAINPVVIFIFDNEIRANLIYCLRRKQRS